MKKVKPIKAWALYQRGQFIESHINQSVVETRRIALRDLDNHLRLSVREVIIRPLPTKRRAK